MRRLRWALLGAAVVGALWLLVAAGNTLGRYLGWTVPARDPETLAETLRPYYRVLKPDGPGRFPTALLYSGCDGPHDNLDRWAAMLNGPGWAAVIVDSHGGWIASAPDLLRFLTAVDGFPTRPDMLQPQTIATMQTTAIGVWGASPYYYAMGWLRRPQEDNWWHDGSLPGTTTLLVRAGNGLAWAALFNARHMKPNSQFAAELDPAIWQAVREVGTWPSGDLFH